MPILRKLRREDVENELSATAQRILEELVRHSQADGATAHELEYDLDLSYNTILTTLRELERNGRVWRQEGAREPQGWGEGRPQDVWRLRRR